MANNKLALVTGGSRGIGRDIALTLAGQGKDVVLTYNQDKDAAEQVVAQIQQLGGKAAAVQLDLSSSTALTPFFEQLKQTLQAHWNVSTIDFLVNNAGMGAARPIADLTEEFFDTFVNVHFKSVVFLTQKSLEMMNEGGGVVFITAAADRYNVPGYGAYAACKGAIEVFSRYVAKEYGYRGIRSNSVAPGGIVTDFNNAAIRSNPKAQEFIIAQTPMGRLGEAHDIGGIVGLLCNDDARWLTGQRLEVTGGFNL